MKGFCISRFSINRNYIQIIFGGLKVIWNFFSSDLSGARHSIVFHGNGLLQLSFDIFIHNFNQAAALPIPDYQPFQLLITSQIFTRLVSTDHWHHQEEQRKGNLWKITAKLNHVKECRSFLFAFGELLHTNKKDVMTFKLFILKLTEFVGRVGVARKLKKGIFCVETKSRLLSLFFFKKNNVCTEYWSCQHVLW